MQAIYVGVGVTNDVALYRSTDAGATWEPVAGQPTAMMPHHAVLDGCGNLYLAYNDGPGPNNIKNGEAYDARTGEACQDYVSGVVKAYVAALTKKP